MHMLTHMAISLAFDLGIQQDPRENKIRRGKGGRSILGPHSAQLVRSLEERRTMIALFHLSSAYVIHRASS